MIPVQANKIPDHKLEPWFIEIMLAFMLLMAFVLVMRIVNEPANIEGVTVFNRQPRGHDDLFTIEDGN